MPEFITIGPRKMIQICKMCISIILNALNNLREGGVDTHLKGI